MTTTTDRPAAIRTALRDLVAEHGFHGTSMSAIARAAGVKYLILSHHDPARTDPQIDAIEDQVRELFPSTYAARDGMTLEVEGPVFDTYACAIQ